MWLTNNLHAAASIAAMKKGTHVFCQKPLTHTIYEARRMAEVAKQTGVVYNLKRMINILGGRSLFER